MTFLDLPCKGRQDAMQLVHDFELILVFLTSKRDFCQDFIHTIAEVISKDAKLGQLARPVLGNTELKVQRLRADQEVIRHVKTSLRWCFLVRGNTNRRIQVHFEVTEESFGGSSSFHNGMDGRKNDRDEIVMHGMHTFL